MYTDPQISLEDQRKWYQRIVQDYSRMDWIIYADGGNVGVVSLYDIAPLYRRCYWAFYLGDESARGKGIGRAVELNILRYVFIRLNFHKLCSEVFQWNESVVRMHQKNGSKIEGVLQEHIWKNGIYHNVICMGILRHEWENMIIEKLQYSPAKIEEWEDKIQHLTKCEGSTT